MLYFERGSPTDKLSIDDLRAGINAALAKSARANACS
jgi:hypothetical protein